MEWFLRIWLPIAIAVTGMAAVSLTTVQYVYRQSLNDPQVQIAEDFATALDNGATPTALISTSTKIDIASSLRPYTVIYDKDLNPLAWNGEYQTKPPMPPAVIFEDAKGRKGTGLGENRVIWEPEADVRSAIVVVHVLETDGYVLSGRNAREVEDRIWNMQVLIGGIWMLTLALTLLATWLGARFAAGKTGVVW